LKFFADDQAKRMRDHGMEVVKFEDVICQMHDLLKPKVEGLILYTDFISKDRIKLTGALFSALFDLDKFQRFEGRDPKLVKQAENYAQSQWDGFCASEYLRLASEEEEAQSMVQGGARGWM
jgi:serine/threonine-protein phosphatase 2A regulatory subunit B''